MSLIAIPLFWLASGLILLAGVARASYDVAAHPWRLGELQDAWKWARMSTVRCFSAGDRRQLARRAALLSACFLAVWLSAHSWLTGLNASQRLPSIVEALLAVVLGAISWLLAVRRSRVTWILAGSVAAAAWWCLRRVEPVMNDASWAGEGLRELLPMLLDQPVDIDARDRWLTCAPAAGPISALVSVGLALGLVRVLPRRAASSQRALLGWAAVAAALGIASMRLGHH